MSSRDLRNILDLSKVTPGIVCATNKSILNGHTTDFTMWMTIANPFLIQTTIWQIKAQWLWYFCGQNRVHKSRRYLIDPEFKSVRFHLKLIISVFVILNRISEEYHCYDCHKCKASHTKSLKFRSTDILKVLLCINSQVNVCHYHENQIRS